MQRGFKWVVNGVLALVMLSGLLFFLQGIRVLPSQVMYGKPEWVIIGAVLVLACAAGLVFVNRRK